MKKIYYYFDKDKLIVTSNGEKRIVKNGSDEFKEIVSTHDFCYYCGRDNGLNGEERWSNFSCFYCGCS